ncbi:hypothetical protein FNV43_RR13685 [Rhamnella rubrinervis]|uniref:Uncharacterized protein n=1 Tax=Rhamnella rubrinervis TaxID=2594499 RepID=A0A8K0H1M7_9ROSA|nr:hypothetical protein FNV43_RR13685 [Rhamnella rubrinervis]
MAAEEVLSLFDSYWFQHAVFSTKSSSSPSKPQQTDDITASPCPKISEEIQESEEFSRLPTIHVRSLSDQQLLVSESGFPLSGSFSPNSVLAINPKEHQLQTILSGKEVTEFGEEERAVKKKEVDHQEEEVVSTKRKLQSERRRKKLSKSLSDLEFEELKGFMDLGFVFTEEDNKDSELVSIIPGLQRLGKKDGDDQNQERENDDEEVKKKKKIDDDGSNVKVSRPYLSEAWDVLDYQKKKEKPLMMMNRRIPALGNKIDMKEHLRFWAHSVASTVR